jgi:hypothetical protein
MRTGFEALSQSFDTGIITVLRYGEALPQEPVKVGTASND